VACGNLNAICYVHCGGEEKEISWKLVGCKCRCQGGLGDDDARSLRIFGGVTNFF
jgi:hypothetical protein